MVVKTKFMTVRSSEIAAIGQNDGGNLYLVFKSGTQHHLKYDDKKELDKDFKKLDVAMEKDEKDQEL